MADDPIEKKPLYHFRPGARILSIGFSGCNLRCPFCQNWHISQSANPGAPGRFMPVDALMTEAAAAGQIAYTYSEPAVHIEYLLDCMKAARERGIANVLVTNGCINQKPAQELLALTDAANVDLKCFSGETYSQILGGDLQTVLDFIKTAFEMGVHVEVTTLVIPGLNDSDEELDKCIDFISSISTNIPFHLSAYHPDYHWEAPPTPPETLLRARERALQKLKYVYTGNIADESSDTICPGCGAVLVKRRGYNVDTAGLMLKKTDGSGQYFCAACGKPAPVRY
jgi:pyruvate formate lyase activating enzyme